MKNEKKQEAIDAFVMKGWSLGRAGELAGVDYRTVRRWVLATGWVDRTVEDRRRMWPNLMEWEIEEMVRMYDEGGVPVEIGEAFGVTESAVSRVMGRKGKRRGHHPWKTGGEARVGIISQAKSGVPVKEIAKHFEVAESTVYKLLRESEVKLSGGEAKAEAASKKYLSMKI